MIIPRYSVIIANSDLSPEALATMNKPTLFDLTGRVAIITGSSRGIGRAIAERLADQGAKVVVSSRTQSAVDDVAAAINATHGAGTAIAVAANISSKDDLVRLVERTRDAFSKIDILVCNAATNVHFGPLSAIKDEQFRKILDNNILSNHWLVQLVAPEMAERGDGAITLVSSIGGMQGSPLIGAYNISKAADLQLARNLAVELGPRNVRVNCVAPGLIKTDFARALWQNPKIARAAEASTPLRRLGEPDDVAGAVVFLSSAAGRYITGQCIIIDGGGMISSPALSD
jgi:NAD(P)-dependent dehydrogenase (short-subunit alcohol dehydrogenase family)